MNDRMLYDKMCQMIRLGFVNARQPEKMRVKVTLPDTPGSPLITDWLPVLCPRACGDMQYDLPDIGDQVLCLFLAYGLEQGFVIGSMYGRQTPPVASGDKWHRTFPDGATIEYDRASHALTANIPGTVNIKASQSITLEAPVICLRGTLVNTDTQGKPGKAIISGSIDVINGGISLPSGDVIASGVSLVSHAHGGVESGSGTSSFPSGGGASPGTSAQTETAARQQAIVAAQAEDLKKTGSEIEKLIICLPQIAEYMAEQESDEVDKQGWLYLHDMFLKWLSGSANADAFKNPDPFWVSWDWLMDFWRMRKAYGYISEEANLFTDNSKALLAERLQADGKFTEQEESFDYITLLDGGYHLWFDKYFQSREVPRERMPFYTPDGMMAAMGSFMLRAVAKGKVQPIATGHRIIVEEVAIVATDSFNFDESDSSLPGANSYAFWSCDPPGFGITPIHAPDGSLELLNRHFNSFRNKGYGNDFIVLAGSHILENLGVISYDWS